MGYLVSKKGIEAARGAAETGEGPDYVGPVGHRVVAWPALNVSRNRVQQLARVVQQRRTRPCNR